MQNERGLAEEATDQADDGAKRQAARQTPIVMTRRQRLLAGSAAGMMLLVMLVWLYRLFCDTIDSHAWPLVAFAAGFAFKLASDLGKPRRATVDGLYANVLVWIAFGQGLTLFLGYRHFGRIPPCVWLSMLAAAGVTIALVFVFCTIFRIARCNQRKDRCR